MSSLNFIQKIAKKTLINCNIVGTHSISVGPALINEISVSILFQNKEFLEELILKTIVDMNSLEYDLFNLIDGYVAMSESQAELWEELKNKVALQYLSSNIYEANKIPSGINISEAFKEKIKEKIEKNEIDKDSIDKISKMIVNNIGNYWLQLTMSALREAGKQELLIYAAEKMQMILKERIKLFNISEEEKNIILQAINQNLKRYIRGGIRYEELAEIYYSIMINVHYTRILSFARIGNYDLQHLNINQIININIKNANQIIKLAQQKYKDNELTSDSNSIFYRMYIIFGKQRTMELIEGKYGEISLSQLETIVNNVNMDNYEIPQLNSEPNHDKYQSALINFLFASGPHDVNANMKKILSGEIASDKMPLARVINEWKLYYDFLGGNVTVSDLMNLMNKLEIILLPNEKEISNTIKLAGLEYKDKIADVYDKMQKRCLASIPKVKGMAGEYEYEILDLVDPIQMNVGYYTNCCFTFGGAAESSLIHACTNEDSRIFVIKKDGKVVAQSWVWRNGNTMCFDNIEVYGVSEKAGSKFWHVYEQASNEILNISQKCETNAKKIQLVTIGMGFTDINLRGKKLQCEKIPLPKNSKLYTDANDQVIVATSNDYKKPLEYDVEAIYQDERQKIIVVDPQQSSTELIEKLNEHINKINYLINPEQFKECNSYQDYTFVMYGFDWFIGITASGEIIKREYSFDERSKLEISNSLQLIREKIKSGELSDNINDVMLDNMIKESTTYGK